MSIGLTEAELRCLNSTTDGYWQRKSIVQTLRREMPGASQEDVHKSLTRLVQLGLVVAYMFDLASSEYVQTTEQDYSNPWYAITDKGMSALDDLWPEEWSYG